MTRTVYPVFGPDPTTREIVDYLKEITRLREIEDVPDFTNLSQVFVSGRTTTRVPSSPSDVLATDNVGDVVTDAPNGFRYVLVDNAGTAVWSREALNISW